jgi:(5-formylfuran-3-yl)methyl phosphate synthase
LYVEGVQSLFKPSGASMAKLLVSVRSAREARLALDAGADIIDIKEPSAGALGAASPAVINEVLRMVNRQAGTSVACGELLQSANDIAGQLPGANASLALPQAPWPDFVKVGLSGCGSIDDWPQRWRQFLACAPGRSCPVAVAYADWREADAPPPAEVIEQCRSLKRAAVLIDTFDKSGPGLLRIASLDVIGALIEDAHSHRMQIAVAGQLTFDDGIKLAIAGADYIAVRGAVCRPNRTGDLNPELLVRWRAMATHPRDALRLMKS